VLTTIFNNRDRHVSDVTRYITIHNRPTIRATYINRERHTHTRIERERERARDVLKSDMQAASSSSVSLHG